MRFVKKLVVTVLAVAGFMYLGLVAWGWYVTGGFPELGSGAGSYSINYSGIRGRCTGTVLAHAVSPDFTKVAEHQKQSCEGGVEEHYLSIRTFDRSRKAASRGVLIASNAEGSFNPLPEPVLPIRLYWKSVDELWIQHEWTLQFHVDSLSGVKIERSKLLP